MTRAERNKSRYEHLKSIGRCCNHPDRPVAVERSECACEECLDKHKKRMKKAVDSGRCRNHPDRPVSGSTWCVECAQNRSWNNIKRNHGVGKAEYMTMYNAQDGRCPICDRQKKPVSSMAGYGRVSSNANNKELLVIDHCHASGKIRGLLCSKCNFSLGLMEDNVEWLLRMIAYLRTKGDK